MSVKLYPPKGGQPVLAHPSQVDRMKSKGWLVTNPKTSNVAKPNPKLKEVVQDGEP